MPARPSGKPLRTSENSCIRSEQSMTLGEMVSVSALG